jgi:hypothetical protein
MLRNCNRNLRLRSFSAARRFRSAITAGSSSVVDVDVSSSSSLLSSAVTDCEKVAAAAAAACSSPSVSNHINIGDNVLHAL